MQTQPSKKNTMRWIAGLDLLDLSHGAACFAAWLRELTGGQLAGVHVIETMPYAFEGPEETASDFGAWVLQRIREFAESAGVADSFDSFDAVEATAPEDGLVAALEPGRGDALIIGRRAPRSGSGYIRLGRVARRLVRTLPAPVIVVPRDVGMGEIGEGPVIIATNLADDSRAALRFARVQACALDRELVIVHVATTPRAIRRYASPDSRSKAQAEHVARVRSSAALWARQHDAGDVRLEVVTGTVASAIVAHAAADDACLLVVGSRRLSAVKRTFLSSVGSELAATSPVAVAVVPPKNDA